MKIYVGNIAFNTTEDDLQEAFQQFGSVTSTAVITDRHTGRSKGFGFVEMDNDDEARTAISTLNGQEVGGRRVVVSEARPREEGAPRPPRGERPHRGGRGGRGERGERSERSDRGERGDRGERREHGGRGERAERGDRGEYSERYSDDY
ncbi:MAG TPA: RNA-binding protein [Verrucomicrobiota bacterium]|nr:RNA-binding protein [Verrucomicrobiota bacterium]